MEEKKKTKKHNMDLQITVLCLHNFCRFFSAKKKTQAGVERRGGRIHQVNLISTQELSTPDTTCTMTHNRDKKSHQTEEKSAPRAQNTSPPATNGSTLMLVFS